MEWRSGGVEEKNEGGEDHAQPYIWHSNSAPRAGAPLLTPFFIYFLFFLNFEGGKILMAHHG